MDTQPVAVFEKTVDDTTYIVEYSVNDCAKETDYDKVKKLIPNVTESYRNT